MTLRLDSLVGREVWTADDRRLGRLEECRAERRGGAWVITEWKIGPAGLFERLGISARLTVGLARGGGYLARWDQLDLRNPGRPRLSCAVGELRRAQPEHLWMCDSYSLTSPKSYFIDRCRRI